MTTLPVHDSRYQRAEERKRAVAAAGARPLSAAVLAALESQNASLPPSSARAAASAALRKRPVSFIVTGQQLGLFGGPLLTLYKALTAIRTAAAVSDETGSTVLPLFWLQGDDHDLKEVERFYYSVPGQDGAIAPEDGALRADLGVAELSLALSPPQRDAHRISVAEVALPSHVSDLVGRLRADIGTPRGEQVLDVLAQEYRPGVTMQEAFVRTIAALLADYPLLFLNSRDPRLGEARAPFFDFAFSASSEIERRLKAHAAKTESHEQVMLRDGSPLFFIHPEGPSGPRYRIERAGAVYRFIGRDGSLSESEVREHIRSHPEAVSTSALLRPLLQDTLLPVAGYVGGAAELQYFRQIEPLYEMFGLPRSLVIPRARFRLMEPKLQRLLQQLELAPSEVESKTADELFASIVRRAAGEGATADPVVTLREGIEQAFAAAVPRFAEADPALPGMVERTREKVARSLDGLGEKYRSAIERRYSVVRGRLSRALSLLRPLGEHQERVFGWTGMLARHGIGLIGELERRIVPFGGSGADSGGESGASGVTQLDLE